MGHTRYQGKMVSVVRDAKLGDSGYTEDMGKSPGDFVLVTSEDGTEMVIRKSDMTSSTQEP